MDRHFRSSPPRQLLSHTKSFVSRDFKYSAQCSKHVQNYIKSQDTFLHNGNIMGTTKYATSSELCLPMRLSADFLCCIARNISPISGISFIPWYPSSYRPGKHHPVQNLRSRRRLHQLWTCSIQFVLRVLRHLKPRQLVGRAVVLRNCS